MPTAFETPALPFAELRAQFLEASTRAITASADLYSEVVRSQADATANLMEAYLAAGRQTAASGRETVEAAEATTTKATRGTTRATRRATRRVAGATRKAATKPTRRVAAVPAPTVIEAPIAGYDDLTADELVAKLPELPQTELAQVAAYEQAHDARATVLERVAALSGPEPTPGYDELTADDAQKLLTGADPELAAAVRDYERGHKGRTSVLDAAVRQTEAS